MDRWMESWQQRNFGRVLDNPDAELFSRIAEVGRPPLPLRGPDDYDSPMTIDLKPSFRTPGSVQFDFQKAFKHGFDQTFIGAFRRWAAIDGAVQFDRDPSWDPFTDADVKASGVPWKFLENTRSKNEAMWVINYMKRHEAEASQLEVMSGMPGLFSIAGGLLGDPLNFAPATLGVKALRARLLTRTLTNPGSVALGLKPVVFGGIGDGLRAASATSAIALAEAGFQKYLDPTAEPGGLSDIIALPAALSGGIAMLGGGAGRFQAGMTGLKRAAGNADFLAHTKPAARARFLDEGEGPAAPGILTPKEREFWSRAAESAPDGRFHVAGKVEDVAGANVHFRTSEGQSVTIALRDVDKVTGEGGTGLVISSKALLRSDALMASAMKMDGLFLDGVEPGLLKGDRTLRPGSLATDYPAMRAQELARSGILSSLDDVEISRGSLSAAAPGGIAHSRRSQLTGNSFVPTHLGLERLPFDVLQRAAMSPFTTWQTTAEDLLSSGGRIRIKNTAEGGFVASADPVESVIRNRWTYPTVEALRGIHDEWRAYRQAAPVVDSSDMQRILFSMKTGAKDAFTRADPTRPPPMPYEVFRRRVGDALSNGDKDIVRDAASAHVEQAAASARRVLEDLKKEALDVGLFREAHEEQVRAAEAIVHKHRTDGAPQHVIDAAEGRLKKLQGRLHDIVMGNVSVHGSASYRPRIWLQDQLHRRADEFRQIVMDWLRRENPGMSIDQRERMAMKIWETLTHDRPVITKDNTSRLFNDLFDPGSAKSRTFDIPDKLVNSFLENDVDVIIRSHARQLGTGIEIMRRFGSTGMEDQIADIWSEAKLLLNKAPDNTVRKQIIAQRDLAIKDLEASRDRLFGHYGVPQDPHRWTSRTIRMAKQFSNLTLLGMSGFSALGDLMRPLMTEGLQAVHDYGFRTLASEARSIILKASRRELEFMGDAMELITNTRALSASDAGDLFGSRTGLERGLNQANSWFFVANGLNAINQLDKEFAGLIIQGKVNRALISLGNGHKIDDIMRTRLAVNGIDEDMARRIAQQMNLKGGRNSFGKLQIADTANWNDEAAVRVYRSAIWQMLNRTVPTPGIGDTPNWFSTELGGLMMQWKSFAMGTMNRTLVSGLQEGSSQFWYGAAAMVGFAMILNEIRSRLFYDRSTFDRPMTAVIADAVDRSSILGWFSDANKSIEILTGHRAGIRPMLGAERARDEPASRVVGNLLGPASGQLMGAVSVLGDIFAMHPTARTWADARRLIPGQNLPYMDPAMDHLISDGRIWPSKEERAQARARQKQRATVNRQAPPPTEN
jgi:hypothetical protein